MDSQKPISTSNIARLKYLKSLKAKKIRKNKSSLETYSKKKATKRPQQLHKKVISSSQSTDEEEQHQLTTRQNLMLLQKNLQVQIDKKLTSNAEVSLTRCDSLLMASNKNINDFRMAIARTNKKLISKINSITQALRNSTKKLDKDNLYKIGGKNLFSIEVR